MTLPDTRVGWRKETVEKAQEGGSFPQGEITDNIVY